jgi:hypothetical protein
MPLKCQKSGADLRDFWLFPEMGAESRLRPIPIDGFMGVLMPVCH